jgi:hypothetical protein
VEENIEALLHYMNVYAAESNDVAVFKSILAGEVDEDFRCVMILFAMGVLLYIQTHSTEVKSHAATIDTCIFTWEI